jgi:hypothetical protein
MNKNEFQYNDDVSEILSELYHRGTDVKDSEIPKELKESFDNFMGGQTCYTENDEFVYHYEDFQRWYNSIPL